jgi:hypothetical protein
VNGELMRDLHIIQTQLASLARIGAEVLEAPDAAGLALMRRIAAKLVERLEDVEERLAEAADDYDG